LGVVSPNVPGTSEKRGKSAAAAEFRAATPASARRGGADEICGLIEFLEKSGIEYDQRYLD
jgi:hypothetical protein